MEFEIKTATGIPYGKLTTNSSSSYYGIPVLRLGEESIVDYGPSDVVSRDAAETFGSDAGTAANVIVEWARRFATGSPEHDAAELFCSQWPDGPQVGDHDDSRPAVRSSNPHRWRA